MRSEKLSLDKFPEAEGGSADASVYRGAIRDEAATPYMDAGADTAISQLLISHLYGIAGEVRNVKLTF